MLREIRVPDIGEFDAVEIVEVLVGSGDAVTAEESLVTLESDKASMDIPAPAAGEIVEVKVRVGDMVSEGDLIATLEAPEEVVEESSAVEPAVQKEAEAPAPSPPAPSPPAASLPTEAPPSRSADRSGAFPHASPSVRRFARELGVDLGDLVGTGHKGRIVRDDVEAFVKQALTSRSASGPAIPAIPEIDFSKFGEVEVVALSRIRRLSKDHLHRSWLNVPHVTQHDEADITKLEVLRTERKAEAKAKGFGLSVLPFLMKAVVTALEKYPRLSSSLDPSGESLIFKKYFHLGVAVDTDDGLVVPTIRDVDKKSLLELAEELGEVSGRAREGKLRMHDIQGSCFTISSLGGIGGTAFTPIVNAPEVAILGVSRSRWQPVYVGDGLVRRLILPFSLSYDHRVVDGAEAARFTTFLASVLERAEGF